MTKDYHSAEVLGQCMETEEYKAWFCSEFEAEHYVEFLNKPSCFDKVMASYDEYSQYYKICLNAVVGLVPVYLLLTYLSLINLM